MVIIVGDFVYFFKKGIANNLNGISSEKVASAEVPIMETAGTKDK